MADPYDPEQRALIEKAASEHRHEAQPHGGNNGPPDTRGRSA